MTEFNNWYDNIEKEYPLYQDKDGYNIGNTRALKVGWKAALEWLKAECIKMDEHHTIHCEVYCSCYNNVLDTVEDELEE